MKPGARAPTGLPAVYPLPEVGVELTYRPTRTGAASYVLEHRPFGITVTHTPEAAQWEAVVWYRAERVAHRAHATLHAAAGWAGRTWAERTIEEVE